MIVIIVVAGVVGLVYKMNTPQPGQSVTQSPVSKMVDTLSIDDWIWPTDDLNMLYAVSALPWPNWLMYTVYQPLATVNETAQYQQGIIQYLPGLATSWSVSSDSRAYTLNLRQNVTFSNGDPFKIVRNMG